MLEGHMGSAGLSSWRVSDFTSGYTKSIRHFRKLIERNMEAF